MFNVTIKMSQNTGLIHQFAWIDGKGEGVSLSGGSLKCWVKRKDTDATPALELSTANGGIEISLTEPHKFILKIPANSLQPTFEMKNGVNVNTPYLFDLVQIAGGDQRFLVMYGTISVIRGITR